MPGSGGTDHKFDEYRIQGVAVSINDHLHNVYCLDVRIGLVDKENTNRRGS